MSDKLSEEELLEIARIQLIGCQPCNGCERKKRCLLPQAYQQIEALINKPEVTEEWIEEKAKQIHLHVLDGQFHNEAKRKDFIRSLVEEIRGMEVVKK